MEDKLTGFDGIFFGVGPVVLKMEIDCLGNFHGTLPLGWIAGEIAMA